MSARQPGSRFVAARHVVLPEGVRAAWLEIRDGRWAAVHDRPPDDSSATIEDLGEAWLVPGLVDTHVHINEPGRAQWEGFATATRAAAAGGITTLVDMPLNSIPATTSAAGLEAKREAARGKLAVDVAYWGGLVPGNERELEPLARAGVRGFKCFMAPSGVDEFPLVTPDDLERAMPALAALELPLLVHAEQPAALDAARARLGAADPRKYATWLASRPPAAEVEAVRIAIALAERHGARVHIVHVATGEVLDLLRRARDRGVRVSAETCPHYLTFAAEEIPDGSTALKCAPPIRTAAERERLWQGLRDGVLAMVVTDHSPCPPAMKETGGDFFTAWGGIASLEASLAAVWSGARERGFTPADLARWMSAAPAKLAGLDDRKGAIAAGQDADFVVWDPEATWTVEAGALRQRHPITPYQGRRLRGVALETWLRGRRVFPGEGSPAGLDLSLESPDH